MTLVNRNIVIEKRRSKGWTQERLAEKVGLSVRTIQRIEKGDDSSLESLSLIANAFEISISELCSEDTPSKEQLCNTIDAEQLDQLNQRSAKNSLYFVFMLTYLFIMISIMVYIGVQYDNTENKNILIVLTLMWVFIFVIGWLILLYVKASLWRRKLDRWYPLTKHLSKCNKNSKSFKSNKTVDIISQLTWKVIVPVLIILKFVLHVF
ncbi:helix-turn-helix transcriptional regulator [Staphylococcus agnetis]|uniref:helix-turn-helix domain-containing protein n=1 Tax=Staphylococcus agnetis TaxID=985762 RepID=UPI00208F7A88|nr:helix-turn-helix transcriptional regulator [Staphylococcus agnetis]MCO4344570.1 helix-turn-helix transcriptional regulator [Staphylococcus agnetis]MCO4354078.1 helix-turn-helix transcriptional regulator [Staphylococcus agnetis]MCO4358835.1 helix-turn-helix transcriptional regulator [Staphylococcus agnetis]MCO4363532.1 helix-turn-helix transcriptional regulator [Staphylococcus agnetis]MCO4370597.1 helix-turn-helix transcriptional regulator [Staphylococcus agnetis]